MKLNCLILDDEQKSIEVLTHYVSQIPFLNLTFSTTDTSLAMRFLENNRVDLIITDFVSLFEKIKDNCKVIFIMNFSEEIVEALGKNAVDFMMKPVNFKRFEDAIHKVIKLSIFEKQEEVSNLMFEKFKKLSDMEQQVLLLIGKGKNSMEIAEIKYISRRTVDKHRENLREKLGINGYHELTVFANELVKNRG
jgi:DNA-binding NarL/FixJ family response regulator